MADLDAPLGISVRIMTRRGMEVEERSVKEGLRQRNQ